MEENKSEVAQTTNSFSSQNNQNIQSQSAPTVPQSSVPPTQTAQTNFQQNQSFVQETQQESQTVTRDSSTTPPKIPGGIRLRFSAVFFDSLILGVPMMYLYSLSMFLTNNVNSIGINLIYFLLYSVVFVGYYVYFNVQSGATPGKRIYGLKVLDVNTNQNLNLKDAILREIVARGCTYIPFLGFLFLVVNFFVTVSSKEKRGIHDKLAKSQVLKVAKSWSLIKQIGLFLLLIVVTVIPYIFLMPKYIKNSEEVNKCILECMASKNTDNSGVFELQKEVQICNQQCVSN